MSEFEEMESREYPDRWKETEDFRPWGMHVNQFCLVMHLSQFAGFVVPFAGLILPIVMWATNKDESEMVDQHGKEILNWIISVVIYSIVAFILSFILIGIFLALALFVLGIIFPIIGAVQAGNGKFYNYPLSITFVR